MPERAQEPRRPPFDVGEDPDPRFTWANERYFDSDLTPLRHAHPGLMDFTVWLNRTGKARLLAQLESMPA